MTYPDGEDIAIDLYWNSRDKKKYDNQFEIENAIRFGFRRAMLYAKNKRIIKPKDDDKTK
jgi:hypothetical protein